MSSALVLRGDAGMGKTALLDDVVEHAAGTRVVRIAGVEPEAEFGFAALQRLLMPLMDGFEALPDLQHDALGAALGIIDAPATDRFLAGLATLSLLADTATEVPLVCIVDDAHWLDRESLEVLTFVGRRLHADRVALLFATRPDDERAATWAGLPTVDVGGLDEASARDLLLSSVGEPLDAAVVERVIAETGGCPLAVAELGQVLSKAAIDLDVASPRPLPISDRVEAHYAALVGSFPDEAQLLLLVAAAEPSADYEFFCRTAAHLGVDVVAARPAVARGLFEYDPRVEFRHPLVRSAVYNAAGSARRRRVHAALAEILDGNDPERRAWHLASAAIGVDDRVADELEQCGERALQQGRFATHAGLLARAAQLTEAQSTGAARTLHAAQSYLAAGAIRRSGTLLASVEPSLQTPLLQAQAARLRAAIDSYTMPSNIAKVRLDAARLLEPLDRRLARDTYAEALEACLVSGQYTSGTTPRDVAEAALASPPAAGLPTLADIALDGFAKRFAIGYEEAVPSLRDAVRLISDGDVRSPSFSRWVVFGNYAAADLWDVDNYIKMLRVREPQEREHGALDALRLTLGGLGHSEMWQGRFASSEAQHSEATEIARALGADAAAWERLKVELYAWQGRDELTRRIAASVLDERFTAWRAGISVNLARIALTILEQAQGNHKEALAAAQPLFDDDIPPHGSQVLPELVEAGARSGETGVARQALDRLEQRAHATATRWALGLLERSRALVDESDAAEAHYLRAIAHLEATPVRTDLARAHLLYGEWLRRERRHEEARARLHAAYEMFSTMGAEAFAERARGELEALGERTRRQPDASVADLTAQEAQVARLAADGATNREIAAKMFISAATVDYHLRKAFRKLGVTSRAQLSSRLPA
jgi:DNA-binding CsgD family transcriptional regulator